MKLYQSISNTENVAAQAACCQPKYCHARLEVSNPSTNGCNHPSTVSPGGSRVPGVHPQNIQHIPEVQPNCFDLQQNLPWLQLSHAGLG